MTHDEMIKIAEKLYWKRLQTEPLDLKETKTLSYLISVAQKAGDKEAIACLLVTNMRIERVPYQEMSKHYKDRWFIWNPKHPKAQHGYIPEHRHIMEQHLGRMLDDGEVVHHINGKKCDNRIENLQAMTLSEHSKLNLWSEETRQKIANTKRKQKEARCKESGKLLMTSRKT